jgi:hypothetical protein
MTRLFNSLLKGIMWMALFIVAIPNSFSQVSVSDTQLQLSGVNGWDFNGISPPPLYEGFDSTLTGTRIITEPTSSDSVQLFQQKAVTRMIGGGEFVSNMEFRKNLKTLYPETKKVLVDAKVLSFTSNVFAGGIDFIQYNEDGSIRFTGNVVDLEKSEWQTVEVSRNPNNDPFSEIGIGFVAYTRESTEVEFAVLVNNLRFILQNGDTVLIDAFPNSGTVDVQPLPLIPSGFVLHQNYPNPFNPSTTIRYEVSERSTVRLQVFNLLGQEMSTLVDEEQNSGVYEARFDGSGFSSGIYLYRLFVNNRLVASQKMILIK